MIGVVGLTEALLGSLRTTGRSSNLLPLLQHKLVPNTGILAGLLSRSREEPETTKNLSTTSLLSLLGSRSVPAPGSLWDALLLWAVPKKRTSHSKKRMRMTHKYLRPKRHYQTCPKCGQFKLQHMLCGHCFRETMKLTAEARRQGGGGKTGEHRQIDTDSQQLNALSVEDVGSR